MFLFVLICFQILTRYLGPQDTSARDIITTILKGVFERLVLFTALLHGYPQILIAFAALKIGTRFSHEEKGSKISNTCFLMGNLMSIFIAIVATIITKKIWAQ